MLQVVNGFLRLSFMLTVPLSVTKLVYWRKVFLKKHGIDFEETFSPVVRPTYVCIILSLAAMNNWPLRQLDVKNAFLHGFLSKEVYMEQPLGYSDPQFPTHVYRLQRALYGLKPDSRASFQRFSLFFLGIRFTTSRVDDMVIIRSNSSMLSSLIDRLAKEFSMKDLSNLHYFLGIEVVRNDKDIFLNQAKYELDLLTRAKLVDCKPISTPFLVDLISPIPVLPNQMLHSFVL